jgi:hypothetical protein
MSKELLDFCQERQILLFFKMHRPDLGPTQPYIQWVAGTLSLVIKQLEHEANHLPPFSAEIKNDWSYTFLALSASMTCAWTLTLLYVFISVTIQ